jgi:hypothetical protein
MLDPHHPRASTDDGDRIVIVPGKVLENIALAMERVDNDISTPVSIEEDVAPLGELVIIVQRLGLGPSLAVHVVNNAMAIMSARYPADLVRRPLPSEYDLRQLVPLVPLSDRLQEPAKEIFNRRTGGAGDLDEEDVPELDSLGWEDQLQVFIALFFMFGTKVGALKYTTGIE